MMGGKLIVFIGAAFVVVMVLQAGSGAAGRLGTQMSDSGGSDESKVRRQVEVDDSLSGIDRVVVRPDLDGAMDGGGWISIVQPECSGVAPKARKRAGCLCPLGSSCQCIVAGVEHKRDGYCDVSFRYRGGSHEWSSDSGAEEQLLIGDDCSACFWMRVIPEGSSSVVCGRKVLCRRP